MGLHYATGLDLNMGYLSMPLDELSKVILTITLPFGFFECQALPLFSHLKSNAPMIYLADVLHTSGNSFDSHLKYLEAILEVLKKVGMQVNAKKVHCMQQHWSFLVSGLLEIVTNH